MGCMGVCMECMEPHPVWPVSTSMDTVPNGVRVSEGALDPVRPL